MELSSFPIVEGEFISRPNRFIARVMIDTDGAPREITAHVANTGRMRVQMAFNPSPKRKTDFTLLTVWYKSTWVCIHSTMANALAFEYMEKAPDICQLKREVTYGKSRFDLAFERNGHPCLYEVKSANLVVGAAAMFPDAPTERGCKHLEELMHAHTEVCSSLYKERTLSFLRPILPPTRCFQDFLKRELKRGWSFAL